MISQASGAKADKYLNCMDILQVGNIELEVRSTPGHTNGNDVLISIYSQTRNDTLHINAGSLLLCFLIHTKVATS